MKLGNILGKVKSALSSKSNPSDRALDLFERANDLLDRCLTDCEQYNALVLERSGVQVEARRYSAAELDDHREAILGATRALTTVSEAFSLLNVPPDLKSAAGKLLAANCDLYVLAAKRYHAGAAIAMSAAERLVSEIVLFDIKLASLEERVTAGAKSNDTKELEAMRADTDRKLESAKSMEARARVARDEAASFARIGQDLKNVALAV